MAICSRSMDSDPISDIRTIIGNHYNSNSILKELIQNARDAEASTFYLKTVKGSSNADHELLKLDALLVFNDGDFSEEDAAKITNIGSTHKLNSKSNVGKYGLGMKSIFHYCDAFFYICNTETAIVNPWKSKHAKTHSSWDLASLKDAEILKNFFNACQESTDTETTKGFMLYLPLRNDSYNHYISKNKVHIESLWQPFDSASFKKSLVDILGVLPCTIESNLTKIIIDTPQIKTSIELKKIDEKHNRIFVDDDDDVYDVYFSKYAEKVYPKLKEIKETGKLPEKTEYDEESDNEKNFCPYYENQSPTLVCLLHKNKTMEGSARFQFCCYLPLDDKSQIREYKNSSEYDCDIFIHSEFETDGGRKKLLGMDFSKENIFFPLNQINENLKEDEAQFWWNISLIQELLSVYLPDFLENNVLKNIKRNDTIVFNYQNFICDIFNKNSGLVIPKYYFYKLGNSEETIWIKKGVEEIEEFYIEVNKTIQIGLASKKSIKEVYSNLKEYIYNNEKFFDHLGLKRTLGTTHITFNNLFTEDRLLLLVEQLIIKRIPIVFSPDYENKLLLNNDTANYLVSFFEPFKDSNSCECSDILNSFELNKDDLLCLCKKLNTYPICQVHNIREKNPAKNEYFSYNRLTELYEKNELYSGYLQNVDYLIHSLLKISESLEVYSISEKNILSKLFQDDEHKLLDVTKTEHIFKTIYSSEYVKFTRNEDLLSEFLNKIDSNNGAISDYLSVIRFIITNDKNRNGSFVYCDCQESDLYTKLFSKLDNEKIFVSKSICNTFKQKNIDVEKIDSFTVKTYLHTGKEIDFSVFTYDEKERFLLTLTGEPFKQVPLHQTINNDYISFTDSCYLIVDESIKLPKGYHNENISFIKLSANRELQERQKEILRDSILTETKALEILFNDNNLDLSDKEINSYLVSNINYADTTILNSNDNFRSRKWIELSTEDYCSPNEVINLDTIDKNINIKNIVENIYTIEDLSAEYQRLKNRKVFLENIEDAAAVLLSSYPRKIDIEENFLLENWDIIKPFIQDEFYQLVDCIFENDKRKRQELLFNPKYVKEGSFKDYAVFITNLSNSKGDYSIIVDLVHLCLKKEVVQGNLQSFLSISSLKLPTENGGWNFAYNISNKFNRSFSKKQQLNQKLNDVIKISEEERVYVDQKNFEIFDGTEDNIETFFTKIMESKNEIDPRLLGLFLFLLAGNYRSFAENNGYFTDADKSVLRENIPFVSNINPEYWISKCSSVQNAIIRTDNPHRFNVILQIRKGSVIQTRNLCNSVIDVDITNNKDGDILSEVNLQTPYNQPPRLILQFLYNDLSEITSKQLKNAIQIVYKVGYYQRKLLDDFYEKLLVSEQASIECTKRGIFKEIFGTLKILKLKEYFSKEFDDYNEANFSEDNNDKHKQIIRDLQKKIYDKDNPAIREQILSAVRNYLSDNQYDSTRILYELLQNADDAVGQQIDLLEKTGKDSKDVIREFIIEKKSDTFIISHYGREINFRPSEQFPNSYKYDLSNMIQISNSDKSGQMNTTGKFGLGFKSVYFLCNQPIIRSGRLQFQIIAGLYPEKCGLEKINKGETRIELRNDRDVSDLLSSFEKNIELSIIFSKFIRKISLYGKKYEWNPDITKINDNLIIEKDGNFTVIRMSNGIVLIFQNKDGRIIPLADKYQKVWHTAPLLDEFRHLSYAINCKFEVDTGRKSLAKGDKNKKIILAAADVIADSFVELYKQNTKNIGEMVSLILYSGLRSDDVLKPFAEKLCNKLYSSYGIISDGYNGFASITNTSRIFSISENCMENYTSESKCSELFAKIKTLLSEEENNILISDTAKSLCRDNIKKYLVEKENFMRFNLTDYLYYSNLEHKISANLFAKFIDLGLFKLSNDRNEILNENAKLLALDGNWYTIKDTVTYFIELDDTYSQYLLELKCLIKIKHIQKTDSIYSNQNEADFNRDEKLIDESALSEKERIDIEFDKYEPDKTIEELYNWWHSKTEAERKSAAAEYYENLLPNSVNFEDFISPEVELTDAEWFILFILAIYQSKPFCRDLNNKIFLNSLDKLDKEGKLLEKLGDNKPSKNPQLWINVILDFLDGKSYDEIYSTWFNEFPKMIEMSEFKDVYMQVLHDLNKLPEKEKHDILTPEALNEYSGSSLRKAPTIDRAIRIGFSLVIRELIRKKELEAVPKIEKFAFMPKTKCVKFVLGKSANPHSTESVDLYKRIVAEIGEEKARFDGYYDIPLILEVKPGERN